MTVIILHGFVAQAHAKELVVNSTADAHDFMLVDNLFERVLKVWPLHHVDLDNTMLAKPRFRGKPIQILTQIPFLSQPIQIPLRRSTSKGRQVREKKNLQNYMSPSPETRLERWKLQEFEVLLYEIRTAAGAAEYAAGEAKIAAEAALHAAGDSIAEYILTAAEWARTAAQWATDARAVGERMELDVGWAAASAESKLAIKHAIAARALEVRDAAVKEVARAASWAARAAFAAATARSAVLRFRYGISTGWGTTPGHLR